MAVPKLRFPEFTDEWKIYKLKEISSYNTKRVSISADNYIGTENLKKNYGGIDNPIQSDDLVNGVKFNFGNILISNIRPYLKKIWYSNKFGCASSDVLVLNANQGESKFLYYTLAQDKFFDYMMTGAKGSKMPRGDKKHIMDYYFRLPSLPEQKKIADFLSAFDKRIETTQKKLAALEKLKKGFMQKIFSQQLRFKDDNGNDYPAWEEKKLGDISNVTKLAGFEFTKYVNYSDTGKIIALRGLNIKNGKLILNDVKYIDNSDFSKLSRSKLKKGDILLTYIGTIGECALITEDDKYYLAPNVAMIRMFDTNPRYMIYFFQCDILRRELYRYTTASSQEALTMENVRKMKIFRPVFPEQKKIADFLSAFDEKMNLVRKEVDTLQTIKKGLLQQMFV